MEQLINAYRQNNLILFIGAGVPINIGLPSWATLIDEIANQLNYDPEVFQTYGSYLELAEYYKITSGNIGKLRSYMDSTWHSKMDTSKSDIYDLIVSGEFPIIYTTNYDRSLENAHTERGVDFTKIVDVDDIVKISLGKRQIIKYHGDFASDESLVLTETDYYDRLQFESPLDIKLRSDMLGKSILFIGYSLRDINIRLLFYKLKRIWDVHGISAKRPKSYLFSNKPNPVQDTILNSWNIEMIVPEVDSPAEGLKSFLTTLINGK